MSDAFGFGNPRIVEEEVDILIIGGGMAACGAGFEVMRWVAEAAKHGVELKVKLVDKAAMDRSGAVAQGLSAINTYMGDNDPSDYVRYVRQDLMGIVREDLVYDVGRHVDDSVHNFEKWGLPIWKQPGDENTPLAEGGKPVRTGRWQVMINGESYKWIVAEAAKKALGPGNIEEHVFISRLVTDGNDPLRIAGAAGFSVRDHKIHIYRFKCCLLAAGGAVNIFRPRSVGEGTGRAWYPVWNAGSTYAMAAEAGAELTLMENRFVPARFKDGYGPVGAWFLLFKAKAMNAAGEDYQARNSHMLRQHGYGKYVKGHTMGTCLRNHLMMHELKEGRGPIFIDTPTAMKNLAANMTPEEIRHLEAEAWEDFLDMTIAQCGVWAGENIEPDKEMSELMPTEPYLLGSHAGCAGIWCSGPEDIPGTPDHYHWGYNRMTTVSGLFTAGDGVLERSPCGRDLPPGAKLPATQGLHHQHRREPPLHHATDVPVPLAEGDGRVRRRRLDDVPDERRDAEAGREEAHHASRGFAPDAGEGPPRAAPRMGEPPPPARGIRPHETHPVPRGDALSGVLLPDGLPGPRRRELALLRQLHLRPGHRRVESPQGEMEAARQGLNGDGNTMRQHENTDERTGDYRPGERRDHRRARREWQRQQYRDAETDHAGSEEAIPHEPAAGGA